jgi:hypothetical protein
MIFYFILYQPYKVLQNRQMIKNIDTGYCTISNKFAYSNKKSRSSSFFKLMNDYPLHHSTWFYPNEP